MILGKKVFKHFAAIMLAGAGLGTPLISFAGADDTFQYLITTQESDEEWDGTSGTKKTTDDLEQEKTDEAAHLAAYNERKAAWEASEAEKVSVVSSGGGTYTPVDFPEPYIELYKINGVAANESDVTVPSGAKIVDVQSDDSNCFYIARNGVAIRIDTYNITRTFYTGAPSSDSGSSSESTVISTSDSSDSDSNDDDNEGNSAEASFEEKAEARARRMAFYTVNKSAEAAILAAGSGMANGRKHKYRQLLQLPQVSIRSPRSKTRRHTYRRLQIQGKRL
ncbi:hypothetical protein [Butyrivibrio sp.]|uniref:hypothetical protein n=1 Tax=Butyrivibrio sp. TaxID=28121 RepID=UPI0025C31612|nr:hypothetical protein [Butyrivibrio sp.]MBQ9306103.1 hypothetical protein [Butyrivibrio sp.]